MAFALAKGFTASARVLPSEIHMLVRNPVKRDLAVEAGYVPLHRPEERFALSTTPRPDLLLSYDLCSNCFQRLLFQVSQHHVFFSKCFDEALEFLQLLGPHLEENKQLLVSLCMGLTLQRIEAALTESRLKKGLPGRGSCCRVARLLPNVACQSGSGVSVFCLGEACTHDDGKLLMALLTTCGVSYRVQEGHMDACAAISASGPAYVFMLLEALSDAGVKNGLSRSIASQLAIDMVEGSAKLASQKSGSTTLAELKQEVISPAGSTIMGLATLEEFGFKNATMKAVEEALVRAEPDIRFL